MDIYIHRNGVDLSPFTLDRINDGLAHGEFSRQDSAWREGLAAWTPLAEIIDSTAGVVQASDAPAAASPADRPRRGDAHIFVLRNGMALGPFTAGEIVTQLKTGVFTAADVAKHSGSETLWPLLAVPGVTISSLAPSERTSPSKAVTAASGSRQFAGFWMRFAAYVVDSFVLYLPYLLVKLPLLYVLRSFDADDPGEALGVVVLGMMNSVSILTMYWLYSAIAESSAWQGTVGKKLFGLRVTNLEGERISFGQATGRFFSKGVSVLVLGVGFLMAAFTERKRALHDIMAGTLVVRADVSKVTNSNRVTETAPTVTREYPPAGTMATVATITSEPSLEQNAKKQSPPAARSATQPPPASESSPLPIVVVLVVAGMIGFAVFLTVMSKPHVAHNRANAPLDDQGGDPVVRLASMTTAQAYAYGYGQIKPQFDQMMASVKDNLHPESTMNQSRRQHGEPELTPANVAAEMRQACEEVEQDPDVKVALRDRAMKAGVSGESLDSYLQGRTAGAKALDQARERSLPALGATPAVAPAKEASENDNRPEVDAEDVEKSPLGDLIVSRSSEKHDHGEIWLDCVDNSRRIAFLCDHDWRTGQVSFSPDEQWIVVTDGGGPGSSLGTELRAFRREYQNVYTEIPDASIAEAATKAVLRSKHVAESVQPEHVYAEMGGWSADGQTLKLTVWGHGAGYPGDGSLAPTEVNYSMAAMKANFHNDDARQNTATPNRATAASPVPQESDDSDGGYTTYTNRKHGYSVVVPAILCSALQENASGDSVTASSNDGRIKLLLRVKRGIGTAETLYKQWTAEHTATDPGKVVDYKTLVGSWFVVSGHDGPRGYYVKVVVRGSESLFLCLEYDEKQSNDLGKMVTRMSRSFTGDLNPSSENRVQATPSASIGPAQIGAEKIKHPVRAQISLAHGGQMYGTEPIGNVEVTYMDGTKDWWTANGDCGQAHVAADGTVGWTVYSPEHKAATASYSTRPDRALVLCKQGRILSKITSTLGYIEDWHFLNDGGEIGLRTRALHGVALIERHNSVTGQLLESVKAYESGLPAWAMPFADR